MNENNTFLNTPKADLEKEIEVLELKIKLLEQIDALAESKIQPLMESFEDSNDIILDAIDMLDGNLDIIDPNDHSEPELHRKIAMKKISTLYILHVGDCILGAFFCRARALSQGRLIQEGEKWTVSAVQYCGLI